jgi:acyl-CoA thioester hydrolase
MADGDGSTAAASPEKTDPYHDVWETRVRFAETDAQGVVFFGEYLTYLDETFAAFLEAIDYPYDQLVAEGWETHVVNVDVDYHGTAGFTDDLVCGTYVSAIRNSSLTFEWRCRRGEETLASGSVTHVAVDAESGASVRVPDSFREAVVAFQSVAPDPV